jgi:hypothetical protein
MHAARQLCKKKACIYPVAPQLVPDVVNHTYKVIMKTIKLILLSSLLAIAAGGAMAQGTSDRSEQLRRSSEMNMPSTLGTAYGPERARMSWPVSQADRAAEEAMNSTEMMKPSSLRSWPTGGRTTSAVPLNEADRKVAETMQSTERMKPN